MRLAVILLGAALASLGCAERPLDTDEADPGAGAPPDEATSALRPRPIEVPPGVSVQSITGGGPGCADPGSLAVVIAADGSSFLVIFDDMLLQHPPGPPVKHLNCVANVKIQAPEGWRFSVSTVSTRGYAYLSDRHSARIASKYFFSGSPPGGMRTSSLSGPYDDTYVFTDEIAPTGWSKCGGDSIFHIHTQLTLSVVHNRDDAAYLNAETVDGKLEKRLYWRWERCR